jgi:hypothetical protein
MNKSGNMIERWKEEGNAEYFYFVHIAKSAGKFSQFRKKIQSLSKYCVNTYFHT